MGTNFTLEFGIRYHETASSLTALTEWFLRIKKGHSGCSP